MGIQLITEIMDHAPPMTPAEWRALIVLAETKDAARKEAWARRGAAFFQSRARRTASAAERHIGGARAQPSGAQPSIGSKGAA